MRYIFSKSIFKLICIAFAIALFPNFASSQSAETNLPLQLKGHGGPIKAISISADGTRALTASFDYAIILWDLTNSNEQIIHRLIGHDAAVNDVAFLPDLKRAISVSDDGSLGIWDLVEGKLITRIQGKVFKTLDVALAPDQRFAASARWDATARIYDLTTNKEVGELKGHKGNVNSVAFSSDSTKVYTASYDGQIIEWDRVTGKMLRPIYNHGWGINSIARIDEDRILFGSIDGSVGIVSIEKAEKIHDLTKRERPIQTVKVSQDNTLLGFGDGTGQIEIFDVVELKPVEVGKVAYGPVWDFDFVPGTSQIYHVGLDDFVARWQISPSKILQIQSKFPRRFQVSKTNDLGELEFSRKCSVCHTLTPDDANRAGPTLFNVFGRKAGTLPGYPYSKALLKSEIIWSKKTIGELFDYGPDVVTPGTKMPIQRLKSVTRRNDLIDYLERATRPN